MLHLVAYVLGTLVGLASNIYVVQTSSEAKTMDVLLVVDMQEGLLQGKPKHDLSGVIERINRLAGRVRERGGCVLFVQHDGPSGDDFAPFTQGWAILGSLERAPGDRIVRKTKNDAFFGTSLQSDLEEIGAGRILVAGWATDMCVDATVRSTWTPSASSSTTIGSGRTCSRNTRSRSRAKRGSDPQLESGWQRCSTAPARAVEPAMRSAESSLGQ